MPPIVTLPVNVAATPVILFIAISGVPVSPPAVPVVFWFRVATLAAATVPEAIADPLSAVRFAPDPKKVDAVTELPTDTLVAVTIPVTCIPLPPTVVALPNVETPDTDKLSKNLTLVDVVMLILHHLQRMMLQLQYQ